MNFEELKAVSEFTNQLRTADISKIQTLIKLPEALCADISKGTPFLTAMKQWRGRSPFLFYQALQDIRPDLVKAACRIPWLCVQLQVKVKIKQKNYLSTH